MEMHHLLKELQVLMYGNLESGVEGLTITLSDVAGLFSSRWLKLDGLFMCGHSIIDIYISFIMMTMYMYDRFKDV